MKNVCGVLIPELGHSVFERFNISVIDDLVWCGEWRPGEF